MHSTIVFSESIGSIEVRINTESDQLLEGTESFSVQLSHDHSEENVLLLPAHSNILIRDRDSKFASESMFFFSFFLNSFWSSVCMDMVGV